MRCSVKGCQRKATHIIRDAFQREANGKPVCESNVCWGILTGGYPAEGRPLRKTGR